MNVIDNYEDVINTVMNSDVMKRRWDIYKSDFGYAADIEFEETCDAVSKIMSEVLYGSE